MEENKCGFCKKIRAEDEYCVQIYHENGVDCVTQSNYTAEFVYRPPGEKEQPVNFLSDSNGRQATGFFREDI